MTQPLKTLITADSLDFSLEHVSKYYDTDFFPRAEEFLAIKHSWDEVKNYILEADLDKILSAPPVVEPWPKTKSGFRIVHRPEPLDSLIYTALAKIVATSVEAARATPEVACSYRISATDASFFSDGSGFHVYRERCETLAAAFPYVLTTDISDFYNKIYLHRLQNALQIATDNPPGISKRIEYFLTTLNTKASQGIPVGPAASIIMAEATLIDADQFFFARGFDHVRYVDDFRVFGNSREELRSLLQDFCVYLHENQRLSLSAEKTRISKSEDFLSKELNNQYQLEKLEILGEIEIVNPYTMEVEDFDIVVVDNAGEILLDALNRITKFETLDLGVIRAIVRRAKAHGIKDIAATLLDNLEFFAPAVNDIALYLDAISDDDFIHSHKPKLQAICGEPAMNLRSVRMWFEWYFSRHAPLLNVAKIRAFVFSSKGLRPHARASITLKHQTWVKERKSQLLHYAYWDRRSILLAAQVLAKDERDKWLEPLVKGNALSQMDKWMAKWVMAGAPA
ncbi:RNA-directed DNA polymerase [Burkholderia thailandensis]|uniref:RNA-directed DNA polymerase n=1 Tax=Burkholderia thailandensis TaxID=57975 RepID=UPI0022AC43ED|nr:RNA-directed DNA polymerase [Burkholderia thailandensis]MCZ2901191.1 RNA-directed DNA polymerase [Burkholderia thailandensis]MDD1481257.1 RNA-directed DNA polymerase [Burkholderia thailandensis]MDD1487922.1 RNA-directed DNA polymerase [Burkholderia thailandensis]MDD1494216.1 RNA-directed DNA polymerase [Burkholderia thailandensis]